MISSSSSVPHPAPSQYERARQDAEKEKAAVAALLKEQLGLELSETKTLVTPVTKPSLSSGTMSSCARQPRLQADWRA